MKNEATSLCKHSEKALYDPAIPPPPPFALIGREPELAQIKQRLNGCGNVALTVLHGLPGVGKTSLAVALAHDQQIREAFADGILWVGVGPNPNLSSLLSRWAGLLDLSATQMAKLRGVNEWASAVRAAIGQRNMLVIIDDVWQLEQVQALRVGAHRCAHLVTTRFLAIAAHLAGDGAMLISELNEDASVQLLSRAAQERIEAEAVQDLVQAVGGLPLALTLLGNYLRKQASHERMTATLEHLSSAQERLQISEPYIFSEHPNLKEHTSLSLQSVIAVSDQLLGEEARTAFYRLAILPAKPNTFSEEVALAVTECAYDELDALSDSGLLENSGGRCTLHQVIADYARLHLKEQEKHEASSRLITYIADYVEAHKKDYDLLDLESSTIYVVLSKAYEQGKQAELVRVVCTFAPFLILRGLYSLADPFLQRAYDAAVELDDKEGTIEALLYLGEIEQRLGNYARAETSLQEGLTLARSLNSHERICALLTQLGKVFQEQGNLQPAEAVYQEGLTLARKSADPIRIATLLDNLGWLIMKRGEFAESERLLQEGLALARSIEDRERVGGLLRRLGALEIYRGNYIQAQSYLQEGLPVARSLGDSELICALLINLGLVAALQGKYSQAKLYYQEGLESARKTGQRERICSILVNLGDVLVEEGSLLQAEISLLEGLELAQKLGHREWMSVLLMTLGRTTHKQGRYRDAERYLRESLHLASQIDRPRITCDALYELGDLYLSIKKISDAEKAFKEVIKLLPPGDQEFLALAYYGLARVAALLRDRENARLYGDKSVMILEAIGYRKVAEVRDWMKSALGYTSEVEE
jgi:tetratricopeptide (TPR) repeat protein